MAKNQVNRIIKYIFAILVLLVILTGVIVFFTLRKDKVFDSIKKNKDKAIIIVPGIGCSTLHYTGPTNRVYKHGECVFFRGNFDTSTFIELKDYAIKALNNYRLLACNNDGEPIRKDVGLLEDTNGVDQYDADLSKYGFSLMFKKIIDYLEKKYGQGTTYNYKVYLFNYDWRLSNEINGRRLYNELKKYDGGVVVIAFSMGNLVFSKAARLLYDDKDLDRVKFFCSTFPPYNGAVDAIYFLKKGLMDIPLFKFLNKIYKIDLILRKLAVCYQSMYELMPTRAFFKRRKGFLYDSDNCRLNFRQTISYLKNDKFINKNLLNGALRFHDSLFIKNKNILDFIKNKCFFLGTGYETADALLVDNKYINKVEIMSYSDGDGTVNCQYGAYPPCDVDEEDIIMIKTRHNEAYSNTKFLSELADVIDMYV